MTLALLLWAAMVLPRPGTPKAVEVSAGDWNLPVDFTAADAPARAVWDFLVPLATQGRETAPLTVPRGVSFDFRCDDLSQFSGFNFFLVAADGRNYCAKFGPERAGDWEQIELRRNDFIPQPSLAAWQKGFKSFTVAAWRNGTGRTALGFRNVAAARPLPLLPPVSAEVVDSCLAQMPPPAADELSLVSIHDADAVTDWLATIASVKRWGFLRLQLQPTFVKRPSACVWAAQTEGPGVLQVSCAVKHYRALYDRRIEGRRLLC